MTHPFIPQMSKAERRRLIIHGIARAVLVAALLTAVYYTLPLNRLGSVPFWLVVSVGVLALGVVTVYQVRRIVRHAHPAVQAIEAVMITGPLFLFLFAATYYQMAQSDPANFNVTGLTRTDTLYFTVTTFATVGFGDIVATSQSARLIVTVQMILDLIVLGAVIRVFLGAVRLARGQAPLAPPEH